MNCKFWLTASHANLHAQLNSGQLIFKYVFSELFQSKRLLKYDTYVES